MPPFYARAMEVNGGDPSDSPMPKWSPELAVDYMDSHEIGTGILSLSHRAWSAGAETNGARWLGE